jgi:integrase
MRWVVRIGHGPRTPIKGEYGSPEFMAAYHSAVRGEALEPKAKRVDPQSLAFLVARYEASSAWAALAPATRRQRANILKGVLKTAGDKPYKSISKAHIIDGRERRAKAPSQANHFLAAMRLLFRWAIRNDFADHDPTEGVDRLKLLKTGGWRKWTETEIERYKARWQIGTRERLAFELLRTTGLRLGDAANLGRQHLQDVVVEHDDGRREKITVFRIKTEKKDRVVVREIMPEFAEAIAACPSKGLAFVASANGSPLGKGRFGNWFSKAARTAGVKKSAHGLRKLDATALVQSGASEAELEAAMGWTPGSGMARIYTRERDDELLAARALEKLKKSKTETRYSQPKDKVGILRRKVK